jgi:hypothetical protein
VDTSEQVGDCHLKVFANGDAANAWFAKHDPEGVAFEYSVIDDWPTSEQKTSSAPEGVSRLTYPLLR